MKAAQDLAAARHEMERLNASVRQIEAQIARFDELVVLKADHDARLAMIADMTATLSALEAELQNSMGAAKHLREKVRDTQNQLDKLNGDHHTITRLRENRRDDSGVFESLADLPHQRWLGSDEVSLAQLSD